MSNQALRPNFYTDFTTKIDEVGNEGKELTEEQQALSYITHFKGWDILTKYAERLNEYLDNMVSQAMSEGLTTSEIGERTMVKELSKYVLRSFLSKANEARKAEEK